MSQKTVAEKLLQTSAIRLSIKDPFTWASGWKSPIYCDNRRALSYPHARDYIKSEMSKTITEKYADAELLAGVATAGVSWGVLAADQLKLPYIYVRPKPKDHGLANQIEGFYQKGQKTVVIEDLISTGKSSLEVIDVLKRQGLVVIGLVSIFTYGFEEGRNAFNKEGISYKSLTNYETLISLAIEQGIITPEQQEVLLKWREDPANWKGVM